MSAAPVRIPHAFLPLPGHLAAHVIPGTVGFVLGLFALFVGGRFLYIFIFHFVLSDRGG